MKLFRSTPPIELPEHIRAASDQMRDEDERSADRKDLEALAKELAAGESVKSLAFNYFPYVSIPGLWAVSDGALYEVRRARCARVSLKDIQRVEMMRNDIDVGLMIELTGTVPEGFGAGQGSRLMFASHQHSSARRLFAALPEELRAGDFL